MKRSSDDLVCQVLDGFSRDCVGSLAGLEIRFEDGNGVMCAKEANTWEMQQSKGWSFLLPNVEYELRDGLMIRRSKKEFRVSIGVKKAPEKKSKVATAQPSSMSAKPLPPCQYGAGCYRLGNADHCLKYSHPGVNEMNREREQVEHNLVNQISKDWDRGKEPGHIVKKVKPAPKKRQVDDEQVHVLAFPSISTATFEFDLEKAMSVLVDEVSEFLSLAPSNVKLILCDVSNSAALKVAGKMWASKKGDADRFRTAVVDLTCVNSSGPVVDATVVVNSTNKDLSPKGSGINQALYKAVPNLESLTAALFSPPARVGVPMLVELPEDNLWRVKERVKAIVHVLGPNS